MAGWLELLSPRVDAQTLQRALEAQQGGRDPVPLLLDALPPAVVLGAMSRHYSLPWVDLERYRPEAAALNLVPEDLARKFMLLPLFLDVESLYLAVSNPDDLSTQDYLRQLTGRDIELVLATRPDIEAAINRHFLTQERSAQTMQRFQAPAAGPASAAGAAPAVQVEDAEAPAIKLVNYIFGQAINMGASDVHLEAFTDRLLLRYRVDGVLHEFPAPPRHLHNSLVSRIKILANLDVAERRLPQDGRIKFNHQNQDLDLRVSILPNLHGEGVVVRILDTHSQGKTLSDVGFEPRMETQYERLIRKPHGILLVTGPTGSGKSTTLYATLQHIYTSKKKFITLEDPVEYSLTGVTQIPIQSSIGFTFAAALRSVLRHDPDVVMLGEIRDAETAEIAVRASMTGHLVFSTLHTNDAPSAVTRLMDMGIPPYLLASSLLGVLAQRLIRRLCVKCKAPATLTPEEQSALGLTDASGVHRPTGCPACNQLGYRGRIGIHELLEVTPRVRTACSQAASVMDIAQAGDYLTLRESAVARLRDGVVSAEDVLALTMEG